MSFFNRFRQKFSREAEAGHPPLDPGEPAQDEASAPALAPETHDVTPDELISGILRTIETSTLFDPRHYEVQARDGGFTLEGDPLLHYVEIGEAAGLSPNPLFYPGYYASEISLDHRPACFLDHYCRVGWQQGLRTSPLFDGAYYTRNNPDIAAAQVIPLLHFLTTGGWEGRRPHPLFQTLEYAQAIPAWLKAARTRWSTTYARVPNTGSARIPCSIPNITSKPMQTSRKPDGIRCCISSGSAWRKDASPTPNSLPLCSAAATQTRCGFRTIWRCWRPVQDSSAVLLMRDSEYKSLRATARPIGITEPRPSQVSAAVTIGAASPI